MNRLPGIALLLVLAAACSADPTPEPTPVPTTFPRAPAGEAEAASSAYLDAWAAGDYAAMHAMLDPATRERYPLETFTALHVALAEATQLEALTGSVGTAHVVALPPEPRPEDFPPPSPTPVPTVDPSASAEASASPEQEPTPAPSIDPDAPLPGPVPGLAVPLDATLGSPRFGDLALERDLTWVEGRDGWQLRWSPATLFPELGEAGTLRLDRELGPRGRIVGDNGLVWAMTRDDGVRVYPQEALAGQTIGYVSEVTAEDLDTLEAEGYRAGDVVGRSGLEAGAEGLLRGTPGWRLVAVGDGGTETVLAETEMVPGADVLITIRPEIQAAAQNAIAPYAQAATAVIDPQTGDVWALASQPAFNPNAMTLGTTLDGIALAPAGSAQIFNKAVLAAYPGGSAMKPFGLAAALKVGVVEPDSLVSCPPTWQYNDRTFRNYMNHSLPGLVGLREAMAFSCNTTYMPLSYEVYQANETALTDTLKEFGFGAATGIGFVIEETGIVPDDEWLAANGRGGYSGFEQIQLSIGQGAFLGTPLQLANAYAAIGNGGTLWQPRLVRRATLPDGEELAAFEPTPIREISLGDGDLAFITDTLVAVTTLPYGTGTAAFSGFGIPVAGKSGTAETGTPDPHAWFPAFAPAADPTIAVATVLPYIALGTGGSDAAPLVRRVMAAHFAD
ncbi:MAG TPA: penicillin-binding transpeptidase domain-containing protein [Candidatus Limnocylindria bacterium]|nr:penicillin-binding transpeptidase domain-containing protein [Candidatus Limnocylindria bacterium]